MFPDPTRRGDVEAGTQQSNSSSTSFYIFKVGEIIGGNKLLLVWVILDK